LPEKEGQQEEENISYFTKKKDSTSYLKKGQQEEGQQSLKGAVPEDKRDYNVEERRFGDIHSLPKP